MAQYVADAPLSSSLALEAALGRDLHSVRQALSTARARLLEIADGQKAGTAQAAIDDALADHVAKNAGTAGAALPKPSVSDVIGARVKGWHRDPLRREIFLRNKATKRLHSLSPPLALAAGQTIRSVQTQLEGTVAMSWCADFSLNARSAELCKRVDGPLCEKCFGKAGAKDSSSSSESSAAS